MNQPAARRPASRLGWLTLLTLVLIPLIAPDASAQPEQKPALPAGNSLILNDPLATAPIADSFKGFARASTLTLPPGAPISGPALEVVTTKLPPNPWDVQLRWFNSAPIREGDVILASFWARATATTTETGEATIQLYAQRNGPPYDGFGEFQAAVRSEWRHIQAPMKARGSFDAGAFQFALNFGFRPQTVQIAGLSVVSFGSTIPFDALPKWRTTYDGEEPNAPWRAEADARITSLRTGDRTIALVSADGKPLANTEVRVTLTRHAFPFGTCVAAEQLVGEGPDSDRYRAILADLFNAAVFENDLKWPEWEAGGPPHHDRVDRSIAWLKERNFRIRGHNLVWPASGTSWRMLPPDIDALKSDRTKLRARVEGRVLSAAERFKGRLDEWDVINEPYANHELMDILGRDVMVDWFKLARRGDPNARLVLNDYVLLSGGGNPAGTDAFEATVRFLRERGAPIDAVGEQAHFASNVPGIPFALKQLDRLHKLGLPILITEFDVDSPDQDFQARYLRDFYTAAFSHPGIEGIYMWGFWEGRHWKADAAIYRKDWTPKLAVAAYTDLIKKTWSTDLKLRTDDKGNATFRGFYGTYRLNLGTRDAIFTHAKADQATIRVILPSSTATP